MAEYPALMAGLPELAFDRPLIEHPVSSQELFMVCMQELAPADFCQVRTLFLPNDIKNCVFFTFYTKQRKEDFASPSYYDESTFMAFKEQPDAFLPFMFRYWANRAQGRREYPALPATDELTGFFYEDLEHLSAPGFLRNWLVFNGNLRNIASALAFRKSGMPITSKLVPWGLAWELIGKNESAADFGLSGDFPWVQDLQDTLEHKSRLEFEVELDQLVWQWLDEALEADWCSIDAVLGYFIRLASVERWQKLTLERGQEILGGILDKVSRSIRFSMEFSATGDRSS